MKICHLFYQKKKYGGSESYVEIIEKYSVFLHSREYVSKKYHYLPTIMNTLFGFRSLAKKVVDNKKYDLIHSHFFIPGYYVQKYGGKSITTSHCLLSKEFKLAIPDTKGILSKSDMFISYIVCLVLEKIMYPKIKNLVVISDFHKNELVKIGAKPTKFNAPIDLSQFQTEITLDKSEAKKKINIFDIPTLLFLARPTYLKGLHIFIKAINSIEKNIKFQLLVIGDGYFLNKHKELCYSPCVKSLKKHSSSKESLFRMKIKNNRVIVKKEEPHQNIQKYFAASDILVCPSLYEALGFVNMEAMASGVFVIASNAGGIKEIIKQNKNGLIFKNGDVKDLSNKIKQSILNKSLRERCIKNGKKYIKKYNYDKHIFLLDNLYRKINAKY